MFTTMMSELGEGTHGVYREDKDGFLHWLARKIGGIFLWIGFAISDYGVYKVEIDNRKAE